MGVSEGQWLLFILFIKVHTRRSDYAHTEVCASKSVYFQRIKAFVKVYRFAYAYFSSCLYSSFDSSHFLYTFRLSLRDTDIRNVWFIVCDWPVAINHVLWHWSFQLKDLFLFDKLSMLPNYLQHFESLLRSESVTSGQWSCSIHSGRTELLDFTVPCKKSQHIVHWVDMVWVKCFSPFWKGVTNKFSLQLSTTFTSFLFLAEIAVTSMKWSKSCQKSQQQ